MKPLPPAHPSLPPDGLARLAVKSDPVALAGYVLGLRTAAGVCRSHIESARRKYGDGSGAVKVGRADLCCIVRELRRCGAEERQ